MKTREKSRIRGAIADPTPVALVSGFLGSGKTTLLNALLRQPALRNTAVIVNEFGEIGFDHLLIETAFEDAVLLKSGCVCCTVRGDLTDAIVTLDTRVRRGEIPRFERIAIETTGLADPAPIVAMLLENAQLASLVRLDRVVVTADAVNAAAQLDANYETAKQAALADVLVLTKTDLVAPSPRAALEARLRALNPSAAIVAAVNGAITAETLFAATPSALRVVAGDVDAHGGHDHGHDPSPDHLLRHHGISTFALTHDAPIAWPALAAWLEAVAAFKGPTLLRLKGLVNVAGRGGPVVLDAVQHLVHAPRELPRWPDADRRTRLVFITRGLVKDAVARSFAAAVAARS
ncbi:MAG TPA: GTP-binding protein [Stellaceae bacterium]|nr:GTP-binding protein [Stellaceae bacterium]